MSTPRKRTSKAEARRIAEAHRQGEGPAPTLAPELEHYLDGYVPRKISSQDWETTRGFVLDVVRRSEPTGLSAVGLRLAALIAYVKWAMERDYPITKDSLLDFERIESFVRNTDLSKSTAADYRSRLRGMARSVRGAGSPPVTVSVAHRAVKAPYSRVEEAAIVRIARTQPSGIVGRQLCACVGLGLGAGLDSTDLRPLLGEHVRDHRDDGIEVVVTGARPRTVWVRRAYEDLVRRGVAGVAATRLVIGRSPTRHNLAAKIFEAAVILGDAPHFEQSRFRTTWLAALLRADVPLPVIMDAAGLTSARTLTDLLPHIECSADASTLREVRS